MTLLEKLQAHRGGLVRIKSELYWYDGRGWDGNPGRLCLVLDATAVAAGGPPATATVAAEALRRTAAALTVAATLLLIDGAPRWVWMVETDVELLT